MAAVVMAFCGLLQLVGDIPRHLDVKVRRSPSYAVHLTDSIGNYRHVGQQKSKDGPLGQSAPQERLTTV